MLTVLPNGWILDGQACSNPWAFILVKKCPELLAYICNQMAESEKERGIYQNKKIVQL